jgi:single-strand DNA-binding protein|tara:strand:+ start:1275 stop:1652 length:378 start_codon:yes stop_codon:yes gene_type:complete
MYNNRIVLKGNLTKDPEYKTISEKELVTFRIAVNESIGNGKEETVYLDVDGWGSHAAYSENVGLEKGDRVIVDGRIRQRNWEDKNGNSRTSYSVLPSSFSKVVKPTNMKKASAVSASEDSEKEPF